MRPGTFVQYLLLEPPIKPPAAVVVHASAGVDGKLDVVLPPLIT